MQRRLTTPIAFTAIVLAFLLVGAALAFAGAYLELLDTYDTPSSAWGVAVAGDVAYVADYTSGLHAIDVSDPTDLTLLDTYDTWSARGVAVAGDVAYVADHSSGLHAIDVSDPFDLTLLDTYDTTDFALGVAVARRTAYVADNASGLHSIAVGPVLPDDPRPTRVAAATRYSTAVEIARKGFDPSGDRSWTGVHHVILASGEDRAAADPLAASGLSWAYDAPLFLTGSASVPWEVEAAIKEIADANGTVTVHIVGGPVSVPDARYTELASAVGSSRLTKDRLRTTGDRYDMAATIAARVKAANGDAAPDAVLVANGADVTKFLDALALSPIAAKRGYPILLVSEDSVPSATKGALAALGANRTIVGGGPATVSDSVRNELKAERWSGMTRYSTATTIANKAIQEGYLSNDVAGVAAKLPDALTGGSMVGYHGGVLLVTEGERLTPITGSWLGANKADIDHCYVFGGWKSVSPAVFTAIEDELK